MLQFFVANAADLDEWLEGDRMEEEESGPLLTKDLQYTLGPSLGCVCVGVLPAVGSFLSAQKVKPTLVDHFFSPQQFSSTANH